MSPISGDFITTGAWTSETVQRTKGQFRTGFNGRWGILSFKAEMGDSESAVHVDILDSSGVLILSDIQLVERSGSIREADLSVLPDVREIDIKVRIRIDAGTSSPIISDVTLSFSDNAIS